jgi:hypothetical protein
MQETFRSELNRKMIESNQSLQKKLAQNDMEYFILEIRKIKQDE